MKERSVNKNRRFHDLFPVSERRGYDSLPGTDFLRTALLLTLRTAQLTPGVCGLFLFLITAQLTPGVCGLFLFLITAHY
jgi:hypothetical protein